MHPIPSEYSRRDPTLRDAIRDVLYDYSYENSTTEEAVDALVALVDTWLAGEIASNTFYSLREHWLTETVV